MKAHTMNVDGRTYMRVERRTARRLFRNGETVAMAIFGYRHILSAGDSFELTEQSFAQNFGNVRYYVLMEDGKSGEYEFSAAGSCKWDTDCSVLPQTTTNDETER